MLSLLGSPGVSCQHLGSHQSTPRAVRASVCAYTHSYNTKTSTPYKKQGDTVLAQTNPSCWKLAPTIHHMEIPLMLPPLFYSPVHAIIECFSKHLSIVPTRPVEHT